MLPDAGYFPYAPALNFELGVERAPAVPGKSPRFLKKASTADVRLRGVFRKSAA
jgi:hypothetical protein